MKRYILPILLLAMFGIFVTFVFAHPGRINKNGGYHNHLRSKYHYDLSWDSHIRHPGRTDWYGCHYCRTNCWSWGLYYGQYHCH